jgi:hypothetical protein
MTKVVLNPKHFRIRANPVDGALWLTHEKWHQPIHKIADVTNEVLLALCADLSAGGETKTVERSVRFNDGWHCKITVEVDQE